MLNHCNYFSEKWKEGFNVPKILIGVSAVFAFKFILFQQIKVINLYINFSDAGWGVVGYIQGKGVHSLHMFAQPGTN